MRAHLARTLALSVFVLGSLACGGADTDMSSDELGGNPDNVNVGFNGTADQFAYVDAFFKSSTVAQKAPHICHTYVSWDIAFQKPGQGSVKAFGSRAWFEDWLVKAEGHCDEALVSFKAYPKSEGGSANELPTITSPPSVGTYAKAVTAFHNTKWAGWTGTFAYTPWNEPNNGAGSGNGLGKALSPSEAADYYLALRHLCGKSGCKVAAGDLASNGGMIDDYQFNCPSDIVAPKDLCANASWLDRYKNHIAYHANDSAFGLGHGFRPEYFAYHAWYEVNDYLDRGAHCNSEARCATRALLKNLGGSWSGAKIWDTEVGVAQDGHPAIDDFTQACGAAFLVRLTSNLSARITRVYYTRLHGGNPELVSGTKRRSAFKVLADRETTYSPKCK